MYIYPLTEEARIGLGNVGGSVVPEPEILHGGASEIFLHMRMLKNFEFKNQQV